MKHSAQKEFEDTLLYLSRTFNLSEVFNDFLDFCLLYAQWPTTKAPDFGSLDTKYKNCKEAGKLFAKAFCAIGEIAVDGGACFKDPFGDFYMEHLSNDRTGQFFTPEDVCEVMARIQMGNTIPDGTTILDPCCGSGRLLLACAKINRKALFYAADVDLTCCKMTLINMVLNSLCGEVAWMNSITQKHYKSWQVATSIKFPYCFEISAEQSRLANFLSNKEESMKQPSAGHAKSQSEPQTKTAAAVTNNHVTTNATTNSGNPHQDFFKELKKGNGDDSQLSFIF